MSIHLLFDITELGPAAKTGNGGIRRFVSNLTPRLLVHSEAFVRFSGLSYSNARTFARTLAEMAGPGRFCDDDSGWLSRLGKAADRADQALKVSRARGVLSFLGKSTRELSAHIPARALKRAQIFHSPFAPLPKYLREHRHLRLFLTIYDLIPLTHPSLAGPYFCQLLQEIIASITPDTWITCISQFVKDQICHLLRFPGERIFVTPLAASSEMFRAVDGENAREVRRHHGIDDAPYILSVGANDARKNIAHLVECFGRIVASRETDNLRLVLVGNDARRPALEAIMRKYSSMKDRLRFTGIVPNSDLSAIYSGALAFVFPSLVEGFGLPPLEAMQCGVPVISSNASSLPEVVGNAGILIDPNDKDAWCNAIKQVYGDTAFREQLQQRSLARAQLFTWERTADAHINAYKHAAALPT